MDLAHPNLVSDAQQPQAGVSCNKTGDYAEFEYFNYPFSLPILIEMFQESDIFSLGRHSQTKRKK